MISFPRYSTRTMDGVSFAKNNGAKVIGITDNEMSPSQPSRTVPVSTRI